VRGKNKSLLLSRKNKHPLLTLIFLTLKFETMNKKYLLAVSLAIAAAACSKDDVYVGETDIAKVGAEQIQNIPFEDAAVLDSYSSDPKILSYKLARKLALVELAATDMDKEMGWEGNRLSPTPVVTYGFDNKPKFYDFIVLDAEGKAAGTLTAYARKSASTSIRAVSETVKDYSGLLSKAGGSASLFTDWAGNSYVGLRGKAGESPSGIADAATGQVAEGIKEIEGEQIIEELKATVLPNLLASDSEIGLPDDEAIDKEKYLEMLQSLDEQSVDAWVDSLAASLLKSQNGTEAFWSFIDEILPEVEQLDDDEIIDSSGKGLFSRIVSAIRRVFSGVDETKYYIPRYNKSNVSYRYKSDWCGPWVCGYIWYAYSGEDKYSTFEKYASTVGIYTIPGYVFRFLGKPMFPKEMALSMPIVSGGKIWIDPDLRFADYAAYDHIRYNKKPAIRLCTSNCEGHWTVACGAYQTGSYLWRTYYYLQKENKNNGSYKNPSSNGSYSQVDWWNPWLLVYD
jgi:hypothetical protein